MGQDILRGKSRNLIGAESKRRLLQTIVAALVTAAVVVVLWQRFSGPGGDPGGRVLAQLAPTVSALPSVSSSNYLWKMEPHQVSCDGRAGTFGWSQVVVQSGFKYVGSPTSLSTLMSIRLQRLGWKVNKREGVSSPPSFQWHKTLTNGSHAGLQVQQSFTASTWELVAVPPPIGKRSSGC